MILLNINHSWRCVLTSQQSVMGQNLLLQPERSPDTLSFSDGAQSRSGSSSPNSAAFHTMVKRLYQLASIQGVLHSRMCLISASVSVLFSCIETLHFIPLQFQIEMFGLEIQLN